MVVKTNIQLLNRNVEQEHKEFEEQNCHNEKSQIAKLKEKNKKRLIILGTALLGGVTIGTLGYKFLGEMSTSEAFLNATMILSGMGPVDPLTNKTPAKIFASFYALFSGAFFLVMLAFLVQSIFLTIVEQDRLTARCAESEALKARKST